MHCDRLPEFRTEYNIDALKDNYQLITIYQTNRSVFWLPHSYTNQAVNWFLVEWHLIAFAAILLGRRIAWTFVREFIATKFLSDIEKHGTTN